MSGKYLDSSKEVGTKVLKAAGSLVSKGTKALATYAGEALSACETKKAAADIQAKGELYNLERRTMREMPTIVLTDNQVPIEYQWCRNTVALNEPQAEFVFQHMLKQHALDAESREELATMVAPLVGVPTLLEPVYMAHRYIGERLILPYANHGKPDEYKKVYEDIVNDPVYTGTNQGICLKFNIHSADLCRKFCREYEHSRKYIAKLVNGLQRIGVQIDHVSADGIYLEVYLKWTEV